MKSIITSLCFISAFPLFAQTQEQSNPGQGFVANKASAFEELIDLFIRGLSSPDRTKKHMIS